MFAQNLTALAVMEALWKCIIVLEKTRHVLVERRTVSVIATGHELSVDVSSKEPDRNRRNFFVVVQCSSSSSSSSVTCGDRSFSVAGPRVWNSLPADLRLEVQFAAYRQQLKTVLFSR